VQATATPKSKSVTSGGSQKTTAKQPASAPNTAVKSAPQTTKSVKSSQQTAPHATSAPASHTSNKNNAQNDAKSPSTQSKHK
jgi:hypothetical protein